MEGKTCLRYHTSLQIQKLCITLWIKYFGVWWQTKSGYRALLQRNWSRSYRYMLIEKLAYVKDAANFKKVFTQKPLLISTFIEHVVKTEFVERFIQCRFGSTSKEYNIRLFHFLRSTWHHYCLIKVTLLKFIMSNLFCRLIKTCCVFHLNGSLFHSMR